MTGATAKQREAWISQGVAKDQAGELHSIVRKNAQDEEVLVAKGYEFERVCAVEEEADEARQWQERVLVVHSPVHAEQQSAGLEKRLTHAQEQLRKLTPPRGRGKRQITEEAVLLEAIGKVLKQHRVDGLLRIAYDKQTEQQTKYVGCGRGAAHRDRQLIEKVRYQITAIERQEVPIAALKQRFGWKAWVTNAAQQRLSLGEAVLCYRYEYRIERIFNRLKSRLQIAPLFVTRDDQVQGLTHLLMLGVRVLTLVEFTVRRSLQQDKAELAELHPENRNQGTDIPTAERLLKAFSGISLTIMKEAAGREVRRWLTPLSSVQQDILQRLGLDASLYRQLEIQNTGN